MTKDRSRLDNLSELKIDRSAPRKGSAAPWLVLVVLAAAVVGVWGWLGRPVVTVVETVVARNVSAGNATVLNASGYVTARRRATVSSKVTGKVQEVLIEEGMAVDEGQVMARLDTSNVAVGLNLAKAQLDAARSSLAETRVRIHEAELDLERTRELNRKGVASPADRDRDQAAFDSMTARLSRQQTEVIVSEREVARWQQQLEDTIIRAPFAGVIIAKNAQPGEMISPVSSGGFTRTGIGTIVDMSSLEIEVDVNESYINRVRAGQPAEAVLDAYPSWRIPCHVIAIIPTADRQRATVEVRVGFDEIDARVLPDMGVKVAFRDDRVSAAEDTGGIAIPSAAVRSEGLNAIVFRMNDGRAERRAVTVKSSNDNETILAGGLRAGDRVIVTDVNELRDGQQVVEETK